MDMTFLRFVEIKYKDQKVDGVVRDYFKEYPVIKTVWEFEERVDESLHKGHNSSIIQLAHPHFVKTELRKSSGDSRGGSEKLLVTGK